MSDSTDVCLALLLPYGPVSFESDPVSRSARSLQARRIYLLSAFVELLPMHPGLCLFRHSFSSVFSCPARRRNLSAQSRMFWIFFSAPLFRFSVFLRDAGSCEFGLGIFFRR